MSFKKDGSDPTLSRVALLPGLPGGTSWPSFVENAARVAQEFIASLLDRRGRRVRLKHRKAA